MLMPRMLHLQQNNKQEEQGMAIVTGAIGICAILLLIYYVYVLMKGDAQK